MDQGKTILIVEDDRALSLTLKDNFEKEGFGIILAKDGVEGLKFAFCGGDKNDKRNQEVPWRIAQRCCNIETENMSTRIIKDLISKTELAEIAKEQFGDLVKAVVDVEQGIMAIGGELHADEEAVLLEQGSRQEDLWGINFYPNKQEEEWLEFDSMINVKPSQDNRSRGVENNETREKIKQVIKKLVAL